MSDRPHHRGGGRGGSGSRGGGGHRGGGGGRGGGGAGGAGDKERPKKENILDLAKYMDKRITVKFNGGREGKPWVDPWCACQLGFYPTADLLTFDGNSPGNVKGLRCPHEPRPR